jgi:hypothetical protein
VIKVPLEGTQTSFDIFLKVLNKFPLYNKKGKIVRYYTLSYLGRFRSFAESVRYSLGVMTPFELRSIIARYESKQELNDSSDGNFEQIPSEDQILQYMKGILTNGLAGSIKDILNGLNNQIDKFDLLPEDQRKHLVYSGVLYGMRNRISTLINVSEK